MKNSIHLVTGGAGFIGSHLVRKLVSRGEKVRVVDDFSTGDFKNLSECADCVEVYDDDIAGLGTTPWMNDVTHVYHLAARGSVERSVHDPMGTERANVIGTLRMLELAREHKVQRFVFAGSSSVYGRSPIFPRCEDDDVSPASPYALSKLSAEYYCLLYHQLHGLPTVVLRYFNVFGPRQRSKGDYCAVIPLFIEAVMSGQKPIIEGTGCQMRDFTSVNTVVAATLRAAEREEAIGEVINVASGEERSILSVLEAIKNMCNSKVEIDWRPRRLGDVPRSIADISLMKEILEVTPFAFESALAETVQWYGMRK